MATFVHLLPSETLESKQAECDSLWNSIWEQVSQAAQQCPEPSATDSDKEAWVRRWKSLLMRVRSTDDLDAMLELVPVKPSAELEQQIMGANKKYEEYTLTRTAHGPTSIVVGAGTAPSTVCPTTALRPSLPIPHDGQRKEVAQSLMPPMTSPPVNPPCMRCMTSQKVCVGKAGSKCKRCKKLKKACSNVIANPAAVVNKAVTSTLGDNTTLSPPAPSSSTRSAIVEPSRKRWKSADDVSQDSFQSRHPEVPSSSLSSTPVIAAVDPSRLSQRDLSLLIERRQRDIERSQLEISRAVADISRWIVEIRHERDMS